MNSNRRPSAVRSAIRLTALAFCAIFVAATLFSAAYILTHANHEHDQNGANGTCATCAHVAAAGNWLKQILTVGTAAIAFGLCAVFSPRNPKSASTYPGFSTPVTLKVRLNN
jgi:hypothetical protein